MKPADGVTTRSVSRRKHLTAQVPGCSGLINLSPGHSHLLPLIPGALLYIQMKIPWKIFEGEKDEGSNAGYSFVCWSFYVPVKRFH